MQKRIFIAVNLTEEIKKKIKEYSAKLVDLDARWTAPENIHITLVFIGYLDEGKIPLVEKSVEEAVSGFSKFTVKLTNIVLEPAREPRMIWLEAVSVQLGNFKKVVEDNLIKYLKFVPEKRPFSSHLTLARTKNIKSLLADKKIIEKPFSAEFIVPSIEIMESRLKRGGAEHTVVKSFDLA